jgi:hypothetical protein
LSRFICQGPEHCSLERNCQSMNKVSELRCKNHNFISQIVRSFEVVSGRVCNWIKIKINKMNWSYSEFESVNMRTVRILECTITGVCLITIQDFQFKSDLARSFPQIV